MQISRYAAIMVLVIFFFVNPVFAGPRGHGAGKSSHSKWHLKKKSIKVDPVKMMSEYTTMLRELMIIVKDLEHTPTVSQKKRLTKMIKKIDEMKRNPYLMMHR